MTLLPPRITFWHHVMGFTRIPVPEGPGPYRAGGFALKTIAWASTLAIAGTLVSLPIVLAFIALAGGALAASPMTPDATADHLVVQLLALLASRLAGVVTVLVAGSVLVVAANVVYLRWTELKDAGLTGARILGAALAILSGLAAMNAAALVGRGELLSLMRVGPVIALALAVGLALLATAFSPVVQAEFARGPREADAVVPL